MLDGHDGTGSDVTTRASASPRTRRRSANAWQHPAGADIVLITCGLGGGTGSAAVELVHALEELSLPLVVLATLPSAHENGVVKVNAVRAVNELVKEDLLGWIFVDNSRLAQNHGDVSLDRYYAEINRAVIEPIDALNQLNDRDGVSPIRTVDGEDLRTLMLSNGLLNFGVKELATISTEAVIAAVRECVQASLIMPQGFSMESLSSLGLILEAPEAILAQTQFSQFEQLSEQLQGETGGAAVRLGLYRTANGDKATVRLVCASQQLPEGVRSMVASARREGAQIRDKLQQTLTGLDLGEVADYDLLPTAPSGLRRPRGGEAASAAGRETRRARQTKAPERPTPMVSPSLEPAAGAETAPAVPQSVALGSAERAAERTTTEAGASATASAAAASGPAAVERIASVRSIAADASGAIPASSAADRETSALAHLNTYDQLVRDYKAADSDAARQRVRERLESDRLSENTQVRYYVVRAMSKLDPGLFSDALKAACTTAMPRVRVIAAKALKQRV